jgi:hypothetical protein
MWLWSASMGTLFCTVGVLGVLGVLAYWHFW